MFSRLRNQIAIAAGGGACLIVAIFWTANTAFAALSLVFDKVLASGLTALGFLIVAVGLLLMFKQEEAASAPPAQEKGAKGWAMLAGQLLGAFAAGALGAPRRTERR